MPLSPQGAAVGRIRAAVARGYRRFMVVGPAHSRRLASVRQALLPLGFKVVVIDLAGVGSRRGLELEKLRATGDRDLLPGIRKLLRRSPRKCLAIMLHNLDGLPDPDDGLVDAAWMAAKNHCVGCLFFLTARNPGFVARVFERFEPCRLLVYPVHLSRRCTGDALPGAKCA
jgi:hypothetical protein